VPQNFLSCDREQELLLPPSLRDWLAEDHLAWFVLDVVDELDLSTFLAGYREDGWGRAAFDPAMMVALLVYAYAIGERASRAIERRCREDVAFRVIAANQAPDHATIARFRAVASGRRPDRSGRAPSRRDDAARRRPGTRASVAWSLPGMVSPCAVTVPSPSRAGATTQATVQDGSFTIMGGSRTPLVERSRPGLISFPRKNVAPIVTRIGATFGGMKVMTVGPVEGAAEAAGEVAAVAVATGTRARPTTAARLPASFRVNITSLLTVSGVTAAVRSVRPRAPGCAGAFRGSRSRCRC
jgi:hypothetical protein